MTIELSEALITIEVALRRLNRDALLRSLRPGLAAEAVRSSFATVGLHSVPALENLYAWRNGTSTEGVTLDDIHLFPGFYLLSLEDALANYQAFIADPRWRKNWLPLFANGGGDFYLLDLGEPSSERVRHFRIDESEHPVEFGSLREMLNTLSLAFERGVFFVDLNGYLEMTDHAFYQLAAELNRDIDWWRS